MLIFLFYNLGTKQHRAACLIISARQYKCLFQLNAQKKDGAYLLSTFKVYTQQVELKAIQIWYVGGKEHVSHIHLSLLLRNLPSCYFLCQQLPIGSGTQRCTNTHLLTYALNHLPSHVSNTHIFDQLLKVI